MKYHYEQGVFFASLKKTLWQCSKSCSLIVHPGGTPRNSWWGCADRSSKSWHNFRLKHVIPHTPHFQTSPHKSMCSDRPPYSVALKRQQDRSKSCLHILPDCSFVWVCFVQAGFISFNGWINRWNVIRFIAKKCFCYKFSHWSTEVYLIAEVNVSQRNPAAEVNAMKRIFLHPVKTLPDLRPK